MVYEMMAPMKLLNCPCAAELVSLSKNVKMILSILFIYLLCFWQAETPDGCGLLQVNSDRNCTKLTLRHVFARAWIKFALCKTSQEDKTLFFRDLTGGELQLPSV